MELFRFKFPHKKDQKPIAVYVWCWMGLNEFFWEDL